MARQRHLTWIVSLAFWTALGFLCGLQIWIGMLDHGHSLVRLIVYQALLWNAWFALTPVIGWMARRFPVVPPTARAIAAHAVAAQVLDDDVDRTAVARRDDAGQLLARYDADLARHPAADEHTDGRGPPCG